jgi:hypothetical protein
VNDVAAVATAVPPDGVAYQSIVSPAAALAERVTLPAAHLEAPVPVGALGAEFTARVAEQEF